MFFYVSSGNRNNNIIPFSMKLPSRINLCTLIFQHPTINFVFDNASFIHTSCFSHADQFLDNGIFNIRAIILCPCPRVLGDFYKYFLVKGPIDFSVIIYAFIPKKKMYVILAFVYDIDVNDINLYTFSEEASLGNSDAFLSSSESIQNLIDSDNS